MIPLNNPALSSSTTLQIHHDSTSRSTGSWFYLLSNCSIFIQTLPSRKRQQSHGSRWMLSFLLPSYNFLYSSQDSNTPCKRLAHIYRIGHWYQRLMGEGRWPYLVGRGSELRELNYNNNNNNNYTSNTSLSNETSTGSSIFLLLITTTVRLDSDSL